VRAVVVFFRFVAIAKLLSVYEIRTPFFSNASCSVAPGEGSSAKYRKCDDSVHDFRLAVARSCWLNLDRFIV